MLEQALKVGEAVGGSDVIGQAIRAATVEKTDLQGLDIEHVEHEDDRMMRNEDETG